MRSGDGSVIDDGGHYDLVGGPMIPGHPPVMRVQDDRRGPAKQQHRQKHQHGAGAEGGKRHVQLVPDDLSAPQDPRGGGSDTAPEELPP